MKKLLAAMVAGLFALSTVPAVLAAKHEMKKETTKAAPKKESPVAKACKGKKPGEQVTVDGKKVKCPAPKKEMKKDQMKK
ncbi:MAG TPA: hypothetical protein VI545_04425 [Burkholderiales bacterium]|nr:hypothetical protein [Burkholderiales bacterium]